MSAAPDATKTPRASIARARGTGGRVEVRGAVVLRGGGGTRSGGSMRLVRSDAGATTVTSGERVLRARTSMPPPGPPRPYRIRPADLGRCLVGDFDDIAELLAQIEGAELR